MDRGCKPSPECSYWPTCAENTHHTFHPKAILRRMGAMAFRNAHTERMCMSEHDDLHATEVTNLPTRQQVQEWEAQQEQLKNLRAQGM